MSTKLPWNFKAEYLYSSLSNATPTLTKAISETGFTEATIKVVSSGITVTVTEKFETLAQALTKATQIGPDPALVTMTLSTSIPA